DLPSTAAVRTSAAAEHRRLRDGDHRPGAGRARPADLLDRRRRDPPRPDRDHPGLHRVVPRQAGPSRRSRHGDHRHHHRRPGSRDLGRAHRPRREPAEQRHRAEPAGLPPGRRPGRDGAGRVPARVPGGARQL
ncbi:MAG: hypothetical protein AVDCRST_MAG47-2738, partial [uncultured Nocardioidaceae bacterium]